MNKIRLAIVGCGVMGNRHLAGLVELTRAGLSDFQLVAACDLVCENAQNLAQRAEEKLDKELTVVERLEQLELLDIQAIDLATAPWSHHTLAVEALQRGWHVMVEKPMGVTVRACRLMLEAADDSQSILSVAENFHYDPMNRIGRELLRSGAIGVPRSMINNSVGGGNRIIVTPWRHYKRGGGPLLDVGVHQAYVIEYLMGDVDSVYAHTRLYEKIRRDKEGAEIMWLPLGAEPKTGTYHIERVSKIMNVAGVDWTVPSREVWDSSNMAMFLRDFTTMNRIVKGLFDNAARLRTKRMILTE